MSFSFKKIGVWKFAGVGLFLMVLHLALRSRWPELSPHYRGPRHLWVVFIMLGDWIAGICWLGTVGTALVTLVEQITTRSWDARRLIVNFAVAAAYLALFSWVYELRFGP